MLEQREKDGKTLWCLVSKTTGNVLKWFGVEKPSDEEVAEEEKRIQGFKHMNAETRFRKEVIRVGRYAHPQNPGEFIDVTPDRVRKWIANTAAAGKKVYIPERHSQNPSDNKGWVDSWEFDGQSLWANGEITDVEMAKKIKAGSVQDVSIRIASYTGEDGKEYDEVIDHVAITLDPHVKGLQPFIQAGDGAKVLFEFSASDAIKELPNEIKTHLIALGERLGFDFPGRPTRLQRQRLMALESRLKRVVQFYSEDQERDEKGR